MPSVTRMRRRSARGFDSQCCTSWSTQCDAAACGDASRRKYSELSIAPAMVVHSAGVTVSPV